MADGQGAGGLSPKGDLCRVTTESSNVFLNPLESESLVAQTKISVTATQDLVAVEEAPAAETVVDGNANEGFSYEVVPLDQTVTSGFFV